MRMASFISGGIAMAAAAGRTAGIIGRAKIEITDLSAANQNAGALRADIAGVAFNGVKVITFGVVDKSNMREALFKEKIALLRCIFVAAFIR